MRFFKWRRNPARGDANRSGRMIAKRPILLACGLFLLGFIAGIYLFFPAATVKQRLVSEVGVRFGTVLQIESLALRPLLTLAAGQVKVTIPGLTDDIRIDAVQVSPQWLKLLSGDPGVDLTADLMNGVVDGILLSSGIVELEARDLRFELPIEGVIPFTLIGDLQSADLVTTAMLEPQSKTALQLKLADVRVADLALLGPDSAPVNLGEINLQVTGQGRSLQVVSINARGGAFEVEGNGSVLVGRTAATSRINIELSVRAGRQADQGLVDLLELAGPPQADGSRKLQLTGTLARPLLR